jgi:dephospho-CoA kinase
MIIGLTGTIGSGKSLVASILEELGAFVIDTDVIARKVVLPGSKGWRAIVDIWGEDVLAEDKSIDRKKLAEIVFKNEPDRLRLNGILHPLIGEETAAEIASAPAGSHIVLVVPLLFESGFDRLARQNWVVSSDDNKLIERICARDGCTPKQALARIEAQMSQQEKIRRAHVVIDNSGDIEHTQRQVKEAWSKIEKL